MRLQSCYFTLVLEPEISCFQDFLKTSFHFLLNPSQLPQAFEGKVALTHILSFSQTITVIATLNESQVYTFYTISFYDSHLSETEQSYGFATWWATPRDSAELH